MQPTLNKDAIEDAILIDEDKQKPDFFTETKQLFQSYISERTALLKMQAVEKVSVTAAAVVSGVLLFILALFLLTFVSVTLGFLFSRWLDNYAAGFGIVAGIYLLLILVVVFFGKSLFGNAVTKKMIESFFKKK